MTGPEGFFNFFKKAETEEEAEELVEPTGEGDEEGTNDVSDEEVLEAAASDKSVVEDKDEDDWHDFKRAA